MTEQLKPKKIEMKRLHSDNAKKLIGIKKYYLKEIENYEYLIGCVYFDPDKELQCRCVVTRIAIKQKYCSILQKNHRK